MATVAEGLAAQLRNIETTYGRSIDDWTSLIRASGRSRHGEIVAMLKSEYGLSHGAANRLALVALEAANPASVGDPQAALYRDGKQSLLPIHGRLMALVNGLGYDIEIAPKKGYLSLRWRKQFAMIKPAAHHIDLGLVLADRVPGRRLESAATLQCALHPPSQDPVSPGSATLPLRANV
jgi:hypothetical protein